MTNTRICKKHAKRNWLRLQQEMADPVAFHRKYAGECDEAKWQKQALWIRSQESEARHEP